MKKQIGAPLITDRELAYLTGVSEKTPAQWRHLGKFKDELPYIKLGRSVRYRETDVLAFIAACQIGGGRKA
jgi:excisionase family DNA binding protein